VYGRSEEIISLGFDKNISNDFAPKVIDQANPCFDHTEHASTQAVEILVLLMDQLLKRCHHHHRPASASSAASRAAHFLIMH
jgi:hypothetical protein